MVGRGGEMRPSDAPLIRRIVIPTGLWPAMPRAGYEFSVIWIPGKVDLS